MQFTTGRSLIVVQRPGGFAILDLDRESGDALADRHTWASAATVALTRSRAWRGFWRPTLRVDSIELRFRDLLGSGVGPPGWTAAEQAAAREVSVRAMTALGTVTTAEAAALRERDIRSASRLGLGIARTVVDALLAIGFLGSLGWMGRVPKFVRARRASARWRSGACVGCGYAIAGARPGASGRVVCPECGVERPEEDPRVPITGPLRTVAGR